MNFHYITGHVIPHMLLCKGVQCAVCQCCRYPVSQGQAARRHKDTSLKLPPVSKVLKIYKFQGQSIRNPHPTRAGLSAETSKKKQGF